MQHLYSENWKPMLREIEEDLNKRKHLRVHESGDLMWLIGMVPHTAELVPGCQNPLCDSGWNLKAPGHPSSSGKEGRGGALGSHGVLRVCKSTRFVLGWTWMAPAGSGICLRKHVWTFCPV